MVSEGLCHLVNKNPVRTSFPERLCSEMKHLCIIKFDHYTYETNSITEFRDKVTTVVATSYR